MPEKKADRAGGRSEKHFKRGEDLKKLKRVNIRSNVFGRTVFTRLGLWIICQLTAHKPFVYGKISGITFGKLYKTLNVKFCKRILALRQP